MLLLDLEPLAVDDLDFVPLLFVVLVFDFVPLLFVVPFDLEYFVVTVFFFVAVSGLVGERVGELDGLMVGTALMVGMGETLGPADG